MLVHHCSLVILDTGLVNHRSQVQSWNNFLKAIFLHKNYILSAFLTLILYLFHVISSFIVKLFQFNFSICKCLAVFTVYKFSERLSSRCFPSSMCLIVFFIYQCFQSLWSLCLPSRIFSLAYSRWPMLTSRSPARAAWNAAWFTMLLMSAPVEVRV